MRWYRTIPSGMARSLTLLRLFLIASAVILTAGAFVLVDRLTVKVRQQAIDSEVTSADIFASAVLSPTVVRGDRLVTRSSVVVRVGRDIKVPPSVRSLNAWSRNGTLVFTTSRRSASASGYRWTTGSAASSATTSHSAR